MAKDLFPDGDAVGQLLTVELGGQKVPFRVVGVMVERGPVGNQTLDDYVYVPLSTLQTLMGSRQFTTYIAQAVDAESVERVAATFASAIAQAGVSAQRGGALAAPFGTARNAPHSVTVQKTMISTYEESVYTLTLILAPGYS